MSLKILCYFYLHQWLSHLTWCLIQSIWCNYLELHQGVGCWNISNYIYYRPKFIATTSITHTVEPYKTMDSLCRLLCHSKCFNCIVSQSWVQMNELVHNSFSGHISQLLDSLLLSRQRLWAASTPTVSNRRYSRRCKLCDRGCSSKLATILL